jgi:hypothetical protein
MAIRPKSSYQMLAMRSGKREVSTREGDGGGCGRGWNRDLE